ncbi:hypothetical protein PEP31012_03377 [Pandoraea eparura]|uniref:LysM domain-containing protein n=2 Tax=Pandoraea eparura TaxID=2508291 RepID=A0A5E4WR39_9BURK|nr:hypothetical protein PEP31012_03377 [Pandoraea eparura]
MMIRGAFGLIERARAPSPTCSSATTSRMLAVIVGIAVSGAALAQPLGTQGQEFVYRVESGDTLFGLAQRYMDSSDEWHVLQSQNHVADPMHMPTGMVIRIPLRLIPVIASAAHVVFVQGDVRSNGGPVTVGMWLHEGARIEVASRGTATLELSDGTRVTVPQNAVAEIQRARVFAKSSLIDTIINVLKGGAESRVAPRGTGVGRFEMNTPTMVTGVRGTRFRVAIAHQISRTTVLEGKVNVDSSRRSSPTVVVAGHGVAVSQAGTVSHQVPMLDAPTIEALSGPVVGDNASVRWTPVKGAVSYRVIVARDEAHTEWLSSQRVEVPTAVLAHLPEGNLTLVVTAIDASGFDGADAVMPISVRLHPAAPFAVAPVNGSKHFSDDVIFNWGAVGDAVQYELALSPDATFSRDVQRVRTGETSVGRRVAPGTWWWRVRSLAADGTFGPWGTPGTFESRRPGPTPLVSDDGGNTFHIRWNAGEANQDGVASNYRVQLARDMAFKAIVVDTITQGNDVRMARPAPGGYFVRVANLDALKPTDNDADREAAFSQPQYIEVVDYVRNSQGNAIRTENGLLRVGE